MEPHYKSLYLVKKVLIVGQVLKKKVPTYVYCRPESRYARYSYICLKSKDIPGMSKALAKPPKSKSKCGVSRKLTVMAPTNGRSANNGLKWTRT